jgi:hypothetical protein
MRISLTGFSAWVWGEVVATIVLKQENICSYIYTRSLSKIGHNHKPFAHQLIFNMKENKIFL